MNAMDEIVAALIQRGVMMERERCAKVCQIICNYYDHLSTLDDIAEPMKGEHKIRAAGADICRESILYGDEWVNKLPSEDA